MKGIYLLLIMSLIINDLNAQNNVGIGTAPSGFLLDIKGRARLRAVNGEAQLPGIYLQPPSGASHNIMGMQSNDILGFYAPVAGWQFGMNVNNGFIGIGTTAPSTSLDINGSLRWRNNQAQTNAVLMSKDNDGNATWQRPIVFGVSGSLDLTDLSFTNSNTWNKLLFNTAVDYNVGFSWQPNSSTFEAPVKGLYKFSLHLNHAIRKLDIEIRFIRRRAGNNFIVATQKFIGFTTNSIKLTNALPLDFHLDLLMEPQDQLWVEINSGLIDPAYLLGAKRLYSFSGRLLFVQ